MKYTLVTASTGTPLTLNDVKDWLRLERGETDEDDLLIALRDTAVERTERYTGRKFITATYYAYFDYWPGYNRYSNDKTFNNVYLERNPSQEADSIVLPFPPFQGLSSTSTGFVIFDSDNSSQIVDSTKYVQDIVSDPGRIALNPNESWPTDTLRNVNPIRIEFKVGYGDESSDVPRALRTAALFLVGDMYENRENFVVGQGQTVVKLPFTFEHIARPFKSWTGAI